MIPVSIYNIGCLVGCIINFFVGETIGRRKAILLAMILTVIGAILQCSAFGVRYFTLLMCPKNHSYLSEASQVPQLMVGRVITGLGLFHNFVVNLQKLTNSRSRDRYFHGAYVVSLA